MQLMSKNLSEAIFIGATLHGANDGEQFLSPVKPDRRFKIPSSMSKELPGISRLVLIMVVRFTGR